MCPLDLENKSYTSLVPNSVRLKYNRISDMLNSIVYELKPYIKDIDFNKVILTHDYDKIKKYNYKQNIEKVPTKINKYENNIEYKKLEESRFSKITNKLITKEEYNNLNEGVKLHKIFETENFKDTKNTFVLRFLKHIDKNYINCFKEYEFIYEEDNIIKRGIIDLILEYEDHIDIVDYKMKNIDDEFYIDQLNGYRIYIENISNKKVNIYLYSIVSDIYKKIS